MSASFIILLKMHAYNKESIKLGFKSGHYYKGEVRYIKHR
jgi:hypothetical protein